MAATSHAWVAGADGVRLRVRVMPGASRDEISTLADTAEGLALKARVRAIPEDGRANAAIARLIADWIGVPKTSVAVSSGRKSRIKTLTISGDPGALTRRLEARLMPALDETGGSTS